ncbi:hypothetical protein ABZP36_008523 [Zizania latifolia]
MAAKFKDINNTITHCLANLTAVDTARLEQEREQLRRANNSQTKINTGNGSAKEKNIDQLFYAPDQRCTNDSCISAVHPVCELRSPIAPPPPGNPPQTKPSRNPPHAAPLSTSSLPAQRPSPRHPLSASSLPAPPPLRVGPSQRRPLFTPSPSPRSPLPGPRPSPRRAPLRTIDSRRRAPLRAVDPLRAAPSPRRALTAPPPPRASPSPHRALTASPPSSPLLSQEPHLPRASALPLSPP